MGSLWKKGVGMGLGVGLLGAAVVALRRRHPQPHSSLPDIISPAVFARRVQRTTRGQIVYHVSGEGAPIVFLHDLFPGAASYEWSKVYPAFASSHRVLAADWIGFGESERPDRSLRAEDYAQSLFEFVRATCGGRAPVVVASGLGAALSCLAAAQHPELLSRLILFHPVGTEGWLSPWVPSPVKAAAWSRNGRQWIYRSYLSQPKWIDRWLSRRRSEGEKLDLTEAVSVFASFARQYGAAWALQRIMSGRFHVSALPRLENVCVPVDLWWPGTGTGDPPTTSLGEARVRVAWLDDCGPLAPLDRPDELTSRLGKELFEPVRMVSTDR